jgi:ATP/maltotriose-dependent transcriptional regulator MalT/DNA-binding CsgD family transcriptional regulator
MSLPRERLTALLAESALTSVELVIAPPGYGKTTLLREYAGADSGAVFIALPEATDLESFVRAIIAAVVPSALRSIGALFDGTTEHNVEERAGEWLVSRLRSFSGTLIVDDFHRATGDPRVTRAVTTAIAATHGRIRWIVASRETPRFPMGSWIARGWTGMPITRDDLGFNVAEGAALAASLNIDVSTEDVGAIIDDTLGWPIGVQLALGLVARKRGPRQTRMQTREALFALLDDEVWQPLDANLRALIAAAALMPAPAIATLIAAGFADARARMTDVFAKVPFIASIDNEAFAVHDLFREFVAARVAPDGDAGDVTMRVGSALVAAGNPADGLILLMAAGRVEDVESALATHGFDLLETGQRTIVNAAVAFLDERGLEDTGVALAIRGALAGADGSGSNSANLLKRALERNVPPSMRGEVTRRLAISYSNRGLVTEALNILKPLEADTTISLEDRLDVQFTSAVFTAVAGTRDRAEVDAMIASLETQISSVGPNAQARLLQRLGNAAFYNADLETAERLCLDAAQLATELGLDRMAAFAYGTLYSLAVMVDPDAARARSFSRSQLAAAERAADTGLQVYALRAQYVIAVMNVETAEAAALEKTLSFLVDARSYRQTFLFRFARALLSVAAGDIAKAEATMRSMPLAPLSAPELARRDAFLILLLLLSGKRSTASGLLERGLVTEAPSGYDRIEVAYAYAYRGIAYWALDRPAQARKAFEFDTTDLPPSHRHALDVFKALISLPHPLPNRKAIDELSASLANAGFRAYAELLARLVDLDANDAELSAAELETLREFDRFGGRAADVAKALGKSKFTVQNQIQSAIKKLGCSGRAEALAYARQRGWLDRTPN